MNEVSNTNTVKSSVLTDLYIPISIVIAGAFIGAGLYFSGGPATTNPIAGTPGNTAGQPAPKDLNALLETAGVDAAAVQSCLDSGETQAIVDAHVENAVATGGQGTPWNIVIGPTGKTYAVNGALPIESLRQVIAMARADAAAPAEEAGVDTSLVAPVTAEDNIKGSLDAPIKIVEYSDFDCPFCSRFHTTMNQIMEETDDVAWVYRHLPLEQLHPNAPMLAAMSECVAKIGGNDAFWKFADGYLAN